MNTTRRDFIGKTIKATVISTFGAPFLAHRLQANPNAAGGAIAALEFSQVKLPYDYNALEPHIDAQTMELHYTKHHSGYVKKVNAALAEADDSFDSDKDLFKRIGKVSDTIRNNAGGAWNHNFFWMIMKPNGGNPSGKIAEAINGTFGSFEKFKEQFTQAAMSRFGSGWAWLVSDNGKLKIGSTPNQDNPLMDVPSDDKSFVKGTPVLGLDVWEHAYYLKYQNKRNEYVDSWWNVVNWDEVAKRLP